MAEVAVDFGIQKALHQLGINPVNDGTSTGKKYFSSGEVIDSYSPVDGALIAKVKSSTKEDYEQVISAANGAFKIWRKVPAPATWRDRKAIW